MLPSNEKLTQAPMHLRAIEFLAKKTDMSVDQIEKIYAQELAELTVGARVPHFLPVLTIRKVRGSLR
jgi:Protein of unknown function (DUF3562)